MKATTEYLADNIVAIASGAGYAGVGVIRVSGANLTAVIAGLIRKDELKPRLAYYVDFYAAANEILDSGLVLFFEDQNRLLVKMCLKFRDTVVQWF